MSNNESNMRRYPLKILLAGCLSACLLFGFWFVSLSDGNHFPEWDGSDDGQLYRPQSHALLGAALALRDKGKEYSRTYNPFPRAGAAIESLTAPAWEAIELELTTSQHHLVLPNMSFEDAPDGMVFLNLKESPDGARTAYRASILGRELGPQLQVHEHATGNWMTIDSPVAPAAGYATIKSFAWLGNDSLLYVDEYYLHPKPADPNAPGALNAYYSSHKMSVRTVALVGGEHRTYSESPSGEHCVAAGDDGSFYFAEALPGAIRVLRFDGDTPPTEVLLPIDGGAQHLNILPSKKQIWFTHRTVGKGQCDGIRYIEFAADRPVLETFAPGGYLFYWSPGGRYMAYGTNNKYMLWDSQKQTSTALGRAGHLPYILGFSGNDRALIMRGYRGGYVSGWEMAYGDMTQHEGVYRFRILEQDLSRVTQGLR